MANFPRIASGFGLAVATGFLTIVPSEGTEGFAYFENKVRPILVQRCYECHSEEAGKQKGGLWLDRKAGWAIGGDAGASIIPGDVDGSLFIHSIRYADEDLQMPPKSKLSDEEVKILEDWIAMGAPDPRDEALAGAVQEEIDFEAARQGWAYRPIEKAEVPSVANTDWADTETDRFILADLEEAGVKPTSDAEPAVLLRRLYFDLIGLPPTPEEVDAFVADPSRESLAAIVDDLLARPGFGEKWGRHWLDVARYADSNGGDRNFTFYQAWRYRNWVIDAFNKDVPYYDFVRMQLAGDLMEAASPEERREQLVASTFLALGPKMLTERDKEKLWLDTADEQLDTTGRAFLGLTLGCARCHDHKFDPVSQEDYYAMAGIFRSTEVVTGTRNGCVNVASWIERPLPMEGPEAEKTKATVERLELAMRLTVEKSFMKKAGGKMSLDNLPLAGVIYDEADAELVGPWRKSSLSGNRFGDGYIVDENDAPGKGTNRAIFRGSLPESGEYEIRLAYSAEANRAKKVPIKVEARDGDHRVYLDETKKPSIGGLFEPVGRFTFEKGGKCKVIVETTGTGGSFVIVDAVQFIPVNDIEREAKALSGMGGDKDALHLMSEGDLKKELNRLIGELKDAEVAMAPRDAKDSDDINLRVRGEVGQLGDKIPRNFLQVLHTGDAPQIAEGDSGRMELAEWMVSEENALLDRVMVNRIWHHLFGRGIVATVDNFGRLGTGPTHPELLDYLAAEFRANNGSVKSMVRELVLSHAYRLSCNPTGELVKVDPTNQLFGKQNRRRLTAEEIRDSVLALSGELDREKGKATATPFGIDLDKPFSFSKYQKRTVYLPVARNNAATELAVFDAANPDVVSGRRNQTTVPTQALYLLNSDFVHEQAEKLGVLAMENAKLPGEEVKWLYRSLLGRAPSDAEMQRSLGLIAALSGASEYPEDIKEACGELAHVLMASTEFLYLD